METPEAYALDASETDATLSQIKLRPSKQGNKIIIKFKLTDRDNKNYLIGVELEDDEDTDGLYNAAGATILPSINTNYLDIGYFGIIHTLDGASEIITLIAQKTDSWSDVD